MAASFPTPRLPNGTVVDAANWNQQGDNLDNLDDRVGDLTPGQSAASRLSALDTGHATQQAQLDNHTGRLDSDHTRLSTLEERTTHDRQGNAALGERVTDVEQRTTDGTIGNAALGNRVSTLESGPGGGDGGGDGMAYVGGRWHEVAPFLGDGQTVGPNGKIAFTGVATTPSGVMVTNGSKDFEVSVTGRYNVQVNAHLNGLANNNYWLWVAPSGNHDTPRYCIEVLPMAVSGNIVLNCSAINIQLNAGDRLSAYLWCSAAGNNSTTTASNRRATNFAIQRIG